MSPKTKQIVTYSHRQAAEIVGLEDHEVHEWTRPLTGYFKPYRAGEGKGSRKEYSFEDLMYLKLLKTFKASHIAPGTSNVYLMMLNRSQSDDFVSFLRKHPELDFLKPEFLPEADGFRNAWSFETVVSDAKATQFHTIRLVYEKKRIDQPTERQKSKKVIVVEGHRSDWTDDYEGRKKDLEDKKLKYVPVAKFELLLTRMFESLMVSIDRHKAT